MRVGVVGAGRIGCGFLVPMLRDHGHEVVLVGRAPEVVHNVRRFGGWTVRSVGRDGRTREVDVDCPEVLHHLDPRTPVVLASCQVVVVAVGTSDLPGVVPLLASALCRDHRLRDVVVVENQVDPASVLRAALPDVGCGISSGLVTRVVSRRDGDPARQRLTFVSDDVGGLLVDSRTVRGPLPAGDQLMLVEDHRDAVRRKLYTFNAGHAAAAYLGALKGYHYVHSAVRDPEVAEVVCGAMREAEVGLVTRYGQPSRSTAAVSQHFERFLRPLDDEVARVGREPLRKLRPADRLVAPAVLALEAAQTPVSLALTCAAALVFERRLAGGADVGGGAAPPRDEVRRSVSAFLRVTGRESGCPLVRSVAGALEALHDPQLPPGTLPRPRNGSWA